MLELKHICKTYRPKKGVPVKALNDVSVKFDETGMVFILGKSGCGKSTLLNCIGGLDTFDSGEIVIKGKSSKEFSGSDFDSYRNTFIGFIFQEYNILTEFNIEKNIALALELQGKKATQEAVQSLLDQVDLGTQGKRKTTELSGGQKQRVAIARALIKEPEIIIADEPTGALDSATGKQVFDTLKKLSKDKLVIIVSHDREYAEIYADRIIEMKDGVIISDETKRFVEATKLTDGVNVIGDDIIYIEKGHKLSDKETAIVNKFLSNNSNDIIISSGERNNQKFREVSKITDSGATEQFSDTKPEDHSNIQYDKKDLKLIKSKLKWKDSFKMGVSGLKTKPGKLIFTMLLSLVAFTLFGLADTMSAYNKVTTTANSFVDSGYNTLAFSVEKRTVNTYDDEEDIYYSTYDNDIGGEVRGTDADLENIKKLGFSLVKPVYKGDNNGTYSLNDAYGDSNKIVTNTYSGSFYTGSIYGFVEFSESELAKLGYTVTGTMPSSYTELALTKYVVDQFAIAGFKDANTGTTYDPIAVDSAQKFLAINPTISLDGTFYKITAVIDTKVPTEGYEDMIQNANASTNKAGNKNLSSSDYMRFNALGTLIEYGPHALCFMKEGFINSKNTGFRSLGYQITQKYQFGKDADHLSTAYKTAKLSDVQGHIRYFESGKTTLENNEFLIDVEKAVHMLRDDWQAQQDLLTEDQRNKLNNSVELMNGLLTDESFMTALCGYVKNNIKMYEYSYNTGVTTEKQTSIVGFVMVPILYEYENYNTTVLIGNANFYNSATSGDYSSFLAFAPATKAEMLEMCKLYYAMQDDNTLEKHYTIKNGVMDSLDFANNFIETTAKIFMYIGIGFAVFAGLMLMNFISTSISYKKREIGILRAIGARKVDVFSIFYNESLVIALMNFVLAAMTTFATVFLVNKLLRENMGMNLTLLNFSIRQVGLLLGVSMLVAFIASLLPVYKIARKQPIDAINNR